MQVMVIDPIIIDFFEYNSIFMQEGLVLGNRAYQEDWFAAVSDSLYPIRVFAYPSATWFLPFIIDPFAESADGSVNTSGDWGLVPGPSFFFHGGTFWGVNAAGDELQATLDLFEYLTLNEDFLMRYIMDTGDYPAAARIARQVTPYMDSDTLRGQNPFELFNATVGYIREIYTERYFDGFIWEAMQDQARQFALGAKDLETAIADFQTNVIGMYPNVQRADWP